MKFSKALLNSLIIFATSAIVFIVLDKAFPLGEPDGVADCIENAYYLAGGVLVTLWGVLPVLFEDE